MKDMLFLFFGFLLLQLAVFAEDRVPTDSMTGKILCGYQGWFSTPEDGFRFGWSHYGNAGKFEPGFCGIDLWPDVSELDPDEKFATPFRHADGSTAYVFSSVNPKTVRRHFRWMREYGLDGVMLQRFPCSPRNERGTTRLDAVLRNVQAAANAEGRCWALMYDLSGKNDVTLETEVLADWKRLRDTMNLGRDPNDAAYLHHRGKPVVAVWGIGFNDGRRYSLEKSLELIRFLKNDPKYGGFTVMIGVPSYWRELKNDAVSDPLLHQIIQEADVISPWTVGRFGDLPGVERFVKHQTIPDLEWCRERGLDYMPVVFPGFSWENLQKGRGRFARLDQIPRRGGAFLDAQYRAHLEAGAAMIYQAMFDEMDEGTAIFKVTSDPPSDDQSRFLTNDGLPSDFYLKKVGAWTKVLREHRPEPQKQTNR
ncbi:MAG: xylosidase/arabinosidase [Thermoguttaceae bacterium]|nr:xylosidase/arabinosidase [Thermoguttaceae bacterium]